MTLKEAILKGCVGTEKCTGQLFLGNQCCAIGAALRGVGYPYKNNGGAGYDVFREIFPVDPTPIWCLNDREDISREEIAETYANVEADESALAKLQETWRNNV